MKYAVKVAGMNYNTEGKVPYIHSFFRYFTSFIFSKFLFHFFFPPLCILYLFLFFIFCVFFFSPSSVTRRSLYYIIILKVSKEKTVSKCALTLALMCEARHTEGIQKRAKYHESKVRLQQKIIDADDITDSLFNLIPQRTAEGDRL